MGVQINLDNSPEAFPPPPPHPHVMKIKQCVMQAFLLLLFLQPQAILTSMFLYLWSCTKKVGGGGREVVPHQRDRDRQRPDSRESEF